MGTFLRIAALGGADESYSDIHAGQVELRDKAQIAAPARRGVRPDPARPALLVISAGHCYRPPNILEAEVLNRRDFLGASAATLACTACTASTASSAQAQALGSADAQLNAMFDRFVTAAFDESPELVTSLGLDTGARRSLKFQMHDGSLSAVSRRKRMNSEQIAELKALDRGALSRSNAISYDAVLYDRQANDALNRFAYGTSNTPSPYVLSQLDGAYASVPDFLDTAHTIETKADCDAYIARLGAFATLMDQEVEQVRHDESLGVVPPDFAIDAAIAQMKALQVPAAQSTLVTSLTRRATAAGLEGDWRTRASRMCEARVFPALTQQITLLEGLRPKASHDAGVWRLPDGDAYYRAALRSSINTEQTPNEVHRSGLEVTRELSSRADAAFKKLGMTKGTVAERYAAFFRDPQYLYPNTDAGKSEEIATLNMLVQTMEKRLPQYFGTLPKTLLEIRRIPLATEAGNSTHYTQGSLNGSRPGIYWLNLRDTAEAPFWDMPTTTFHEGLPGHHLQLTLQRQSDLPMVRKLLMFNAYVEGWAMYSEQLAQEMGFYEHKPAWELGYLHDALLRSARMVVDTGIHAKRWTREQTIAALHNADGDPLSSCSQEIERYAVTPGDACGYMVGKLAILQMREKAKTALGSRFNIRSFHDAVLLTGGLPLSILDKHIDDYILEQRR